MFSWASRYIIRMDQDRLLNILRWVVTPIVLACITGYFQARVSTNKAQTKATYDTLAPNVLELQSRVAVLSGRIEELSKHSAPVPCADTSKESRKPATTKTEISKVRSTGLSELLGSGKTEMMVDTGAGSAAPPPSPKKVPARFEDMIEQQAK